MALEITSFVYGVVTGLLGFLLGYSIYWYARKIWNKKEEIMIRSMMKVIEKQSKGGKKE